MFRGKTVVPAQIYNADETGLVYKFFKDTTLVSSNEKYAPGRKKSKERITIMPCTNATGQHKLSLMIMGKSRNPRCFKNDTMPPMHYWSSKNAWQTRELFKEWFLDNATSHFQLDPLASDDGNIIVYFFPPNTTAILQPLDQHIIRTLKQLYRKKLLLYLISKPGDDLNEKLCKLDLKEVVFIIIEAWNDISERTISKGFRQLLPVSNCESPQLELSEANELSIHSLYRQVLPNTNLGDVDKMQWASGAHETSCNILTTEDILDDIKEVNNDQYDDSFTPEINTNEVMNSLNLLIDYAESNLKIGDIFILRKLREKVVHKHLMK